MDKLSEMKYIHTIHLPRLKRVQAGWVCSCVKCKEGSSPHKTRMYFLTENKHYITVYCQHCGYSTNLKTFLQEFFPSAYLDYVEEEKLIRYNDIKNGTLVKKEKYQSELNNVIDLQYKFKLNRKYFKPAKNYEKAVSFCKKRNILEHIESLYYNVHPKSALSGMVIFPFVTDNGDLYGFQGRHTEQKRFHTHSKNESMKVYNLFTVKVDEPVYIFESIIDSLMIPNSIAMLGTTLYKPVIAKMPHRIYITDNDKEGMKRCMQYLKEGEKCFIFPEFFHYKDFNEAVCDGYKKQELKRLIKENTFEGTLGIAKLTFQIMKRKR